MKRVTAFLLALVWLVGCAPPSAVTHTPPADSIALDPATPAADTATPIPAITSAAPKETFTPSPTISPTPTSTPLPLNPLQIEYLRQREYPPSGITIEQTLTPGANYRRYIASYESDGLKIYALLTVPSGPKPTTGWPVIIFNHGYIAPSQYHTTERYVAYVDAIARSGYIVFKSDYRGHGDSEGRASGGYGSSDYTIDILNALASLKQMREADPKRIGMWGHSMGGQVTLRSMVVSKDIKAGVIWAGVVGSYTNILTNWHLRPGETPALRTPVPGPSGFNRGWRTSLINLYGTPEQNPVFWASISPNSYVADLAGPIQLHHDVSDSEVPLRFSQELYNEVRQAGETAELYTYPGDDHNLSNSFALAMQRTIAFFDKYVKG